MPNEKITQRFNSLICTESEKNELHNYLFGCLAKGKNYKLGRNRVMIMEKDDENKYIILNLVRTTKETQICYICSKCFPLSYGDFLSSTISAENFKTCVHTQLCTLIWGDEIHLFVDVVGEEEDLVEVISETPKYMAVIHPSFKSSKGPGVVILSSKMLKPKCISCRGNDCCVHLAIHLHKYKQQLKETNNNSKRLKIDRLKPVRHQN